MERFALKGCLTLFLCFFCCWSPFSKAAESLPARVINAIDVSDGSTLATPTPKEIRYVSPVSAQDPQPHVVIVSGGNVEGLGDFTYGVKIYDFLRQHFPDFTYTLLMYGDRDKREKIKHVYQLTEGTETDFIWLLAESYEDEELDGVDELEKLRIEQKLSTLGDADVYYVFAVATEVDSGHYFLVDELGITPNITLFNIRYPLLNPQQSQEVLQEVLAGINTSPLPLKCSQNCSG